MLVGTTTSVHAHVSEQGIVLLLPTGAYILSGCLAVVFSMLIVTALPHNRVFALFATKTLRLSFLNVLINNHLLKDLISIAAFLAIMCAVIIGVTGTRDPLTNLLPLTIWTLFWIMLYMLHCLFGDIWAWINPWTGVWKRIVRDPAGIVALPSKLGQWPATIVFFLFYSFIIVDLAPDDPARLSIVVFSYIVFNFLGMFLVGREPWLRQVECFSVLFTLLARLAPLNFDPKKEVWCIGLPGWKSLRADDASISQAFFLLTVLACGSFDGVNETFWWLAQIGINPLAFPGRSAVIIPSSIGMMTANLLVYSLFACVVFLGYLLIGLNNENKTKKRLELSNLFSAMALTVLPITAVYHGSHYYTSYLINSQYLVAALSDPLANGANLLGLENYQVTTGYLGDVESVRKIWLTQAGMVVFGHVLAVLMAHYLIAKAFSSRQEAIIFHIPVAIFMAAYTWFGLWLLAAPKGA